MTVLLDTSILLWFLSDHARLSAKHKALIRHQDNNIYVSIVSVWEIAIKFNIGKLDSPLSFSEIADEIIEYNDFSILEIRMDHMRSFARLPLHHRDPFDRLLIAQSQVEGLPILTSDAAFDDYPDQRVW